MAPRPGLTALAVLAALLLVSVAAPRPPRTSLREQPPSICGFANYGSAVGSEQRLVETHLSPGVADWNIVVPMPPPCADAQVTGVDMQVCDADAPPDVSMSDVRSARVHRTGSLTEFAAVNVTVYCILPPPTTSPPPPTTPPPPATTPPTPSPIPPLLIPPRSSEPLTPASEPIDLSSPDENSNELNSLEVSSNEEMSDESVSMLSASIEQTTKERPTSTTTTTTTAKPTSSTTTTTTAKPTSSTTTAKPTLSTTLPMSSTTLPPIPEETTARVELVHPPDRTTRPKGKKPQSIQVTINITPTDQMSSEEEMSTESHANDGELLSVSNKGKENEVRPSHSPSFSSEPYIATPPRFPEMPPRKHKRHPRRPGGPLHRPPPSALQPATGAPESPLYAQSFPPRASITAFPFTLAPPYPVAPLYRPFGVTDPRLRFLQRRQPLMFFRQF